MGNLGACGPEQGDRRNPAQAQFGAVLARTAMSAAGLARLLRRHGWRVSDRTARAWAAGEPRRRPPPPALLDWLRGLAAHVNRDPLPTTRTAPAPMAPGRPPEALVDWLRRLVGYHHRNPPPAPSGAWREDPSIARRRHAVH